MMMSICLISEWLKIKQFKIGYKSSIQYRLFIFYYYMSKAFSLLFTLFILVLVHSEDCCNNEVISVIGSGAVSVDPDTATFYIYAVAVGKTSVQALSNVNNLINQVTSTIQSLNLSSVNISTLYINLYPVYDYSNGTSYIIGQQAYQTLQVIVGDLNTNKNLLGEIATNLSTVNNVSISGFTFQNLNKSQALRAARRAAAADATIKANQYALLGGKNLGSLLSISDLGGQVYNSFTISAEYYLFRLQFLSVPYGKVQANSFVQAKWKIYG